MNLDEAMLATKEEADRICSSRVGQDIAWPAEQIDAIAHRHVNSEYLPRVK